MGPSCSSELTLLCRQSLDLPEPTLPGLIEAAPALPNLSELSAKPPQRPVTPPAPTPVHALPSPTPKQTRVFRKPSMDYPEDPWNTPDVHKNHNHGPALPKLPIEEPEPRAVPATTNGHSQYPASPQSTLPGRTTSTFTTDTAGSVGGSISQQPAGPSQESTGAWAYFDGNTVGSAGFASRGGEPVTSPFGGAGPRDVGDALPPIPAPSRTIGGSGRVGGPVQELILVTLMPEKEGIFFFQHHNYEVTSSRRPSKVVRRYSDFVWLLDCLHKRYPFRILPLLPPKRVAGEYNLPGDV